MSAMKCAHKNHMGQEKHSDKGVAEHANKVMEVAVSVFPHGLLA